MLANQKGIAVFEIIPILAVFILLLNFAIGFFGVIHSGILNSISSRNYAFETFRNRANLNYLRDIADSDNTFTYSKAGYRYHGTVSETNRGSGVNWTATKRNIKFTESRNPAGSNDSSSHNTNVLKIAAGGRASDVIGEEEFESVWVRSVYGICLNPKCGE
jgi:hypothetical protein